MGEEKPGASHTKVWNSPFSPQGSAVGGSAARSSASNARPAKAGASCCGSTHVSTAAHARLDHLERERVGGLVPQREHGADRRGREHLLAVGADVGEEEVAEDHAGHAVGHRGVDGFGHEPLVLGVRARPRQLHHVHGQVESVGLGQQQLAPDGVHRDPIGVGVHRAQEADDVERGILAGAVQRERAVLAAAPAHPRALGHVAARRYRSRVAPGRAANSSGCRTDASSSTPSTTRGPGLEK